MSLLRRLAHDSGCAMLISTHDLDLALRNADRIWLIDNEGEVRAGAPEDLVLSGELAATFSDENIVFDPLRGVLQTRQHAGPWIMLAGKTSVRREWTQRALERCGFRLCDDTGHLKRNVPRIELRGEEGWRLHDAGTTQSFSTLYDLTHALICSHGRPS